MSFCVLCGSNSYSAVRIIPAPSGDYPDNHQVQCHSCGLIQCESMPSESLLTKYYASGDYRKAHTAKLSELPETDPAYQATLDPKFIVRRARRVDLHYQVSGVWKIYEVGVGAGWTALALQKLTGARTYGTDADQTLYQVALENGVLMPDQSSYHLAVGYHVLEHVTRPVEFVAGLLQQAPRLLLEVPDVTKFTKDSQWHWAHTTNFSQDTLRMTLEKAGAKHVWVEEIDNFLMAGGVR